ncbi:MAG: trigger factor [Ignavibacteria bacterium]
MSSQIQNINDSERKISIEMPKEETEKYFEEILKEESKKITIPGFRKGKAPLSLVRKMYGEALFFDNLDKIAQNRFWDEIDTLGIEIVGVPKITNLDLTDDKGLKFDIEFEVLPEIDLSNLDEKLADASIEQKEFEISDKYLEQVLKEIQFQNRKEEVVESVDSNEIIIEVSRKEKSDAPEVSPQNFAIYLNYEKINPQFRELFLNKKEGDKVETDLSPFVEDESKEDKTLPVYEYEIKKILKVNLPELTDETVKEITKGEFETLEAFKKYLIQEELNYYHSQEEKSLNKKIEDLLIEKFKVTPPPSMVEKSVKGYVQELKKQDTYKNLSDEQLIELVKPIAEKNVIWFLLKKAVMKQFNIDLTDDEINEYAKKLSEKYQLPLDQVDKYLRTRGVNLLEELLEEKIYNFFKPKIKITTNKVVL